jgi:hypothetical protein
VDRLHPKEDSGVLPASFLEKLWVSWAVFVHLASHFDKVVAACEGKEADGLPIVQVAGRVVRRIVVPIEDFHHKLRIDEALDYHFPFSVTFQRVSYCDEALIWGLRC